MSDDQRSAAVKMRVRSAARCFGSPSDMCPPGSNSASRRSRDDAATTESSKDDRCKKKKKANCFSIFYIILR